MKIYIAGPMRGKPLFNFPAFDRAAELLESAGHEVVNPAQMDRELGFDPSSSKADAEFIRNAFRRDLVAICDCDGIAMLPGWEHSYGARIEWMLATHLGHEVFYFQEDENGCSC